MHGEVGNNKMKRSCVVGGLSIIFHWYGKSKPGSAI
jgi:hypothetical protein